MRKGTFANYANYANFTNFANRDRDGNAFTEI